MFMSLVLWIAHHVKDIHDLFAYIDDVFSYEQAENVEFYASYGRYMPTKQVHLLRLWDELGIPHDERKQVSGATLRIIGFDVDSDRMLISMDAQDRQKMHDAVLSFCRPGTPTQWTLREFQHLAGWLNWALNVAPKLCPGLATLYAKTWGKEHWFKQLWVSKTL